ncbi:hypothetical protein ACLKA7_000794 [Drosophila subpalustris]
MGRRGPLIKLYCDNATNFVGSARILQNVADSMDVQDECLREYAAAHRFEFVFIPPRAPNFGGLWEAAVKSAKHLMVRAIGNALLREDEMQTVLVEFEAELNSRPLIADSSSPNDGEVITPAHLLIGTTLATLPPASGQPKIEGNLGLLKRWQLVSAIKQQFWSNWSRDYLTSLQERAKWTKEAANLQTGAVVVLQEDNVPPQLWVTGVVTETVPGADGKVRVAIVRTKTGIFKRSIHRLAPLPLD